MWFFFYIYIYIYCDSVCFKSCWYIGACVNSIHAFGHLFQFHMCVYVILNHTLAPLFGSHLYTCMSSFGHCFDHVDVCLCGGHFFVVLTRVISLYVYVSMWCLNRALNFSIHLLMQPCLNSDIYMHTQDMVPCFQNINVYRSTLLGLWFHIHVSIYITVLPCPSP